MLYIFSDSKVKFFMTGSIEAQRLPLKKLASHMSAEDDITYIDISTTSIVAHNRLISKLQKRCVNGYCGVIDPNGDIKDPAQLFFKGIHDYIGGQLCQEPITFRRLNAMKGFADKLQNISAEKYVRKKFAAEKKQNEAMFIGWQSVQAGAVYRFCFLYVRVQCRFDLKNTLGEEAYRTCMLRFNQVLQRYCSAATPLLWIENEAGVLYLLPPLAAHVQEGVEACLRMILSSPLIAYEKLELPFLAEFVFALHIGSTEYQPRGSTGSIVSEAINFIYHLGNRYSEAGRITISESVYNLFESDLLKQLFFEAGSFEDNNVFHSNHVFHSTPKKQY